MEYKPMNQSMKLIKQITINTEVPDKIDQLFTCIDAHTCGNPVRVVVGNVPSLQGKTMSEKRLDFLANHDWIRKGLMFEPRGHDMMSGSILYPPADPCNDVGILFIETSGCLPMCGHGTIGTITVAIEEKLIVPHIKGIVRAETPAGLVLISYKQNGKKVESVKLRNVPSFVHSSNVKVTSPDLGELSVDVAYGGNFYAIVDPQKNFRGIEHYSAADLIRFSPPIRSLLNREHSFVHPVERSIKGLSHLLWTGQTLSSDATARNAVFYGDKAIDRSPCGTGTSARMAQWHAQGKLKPGEPFIHESYIGSVFKGQIEQVLKLGPYPAIVPSIEGWACITGHSTIRIHSDDPYAFGFQVI
jgi:4-hydroxyproline epimerase